MFGLGMEERWIERVRGGGVEKGSERVNAHLAPVQQPTRIHRSVQFAGSEAMLRDL